MQQKRSSDLQSRALAAAQRISVAISICAVIRLMVSPGVDSRDRAPFHPENSSVKLAQFISQVRGKSQILENSSGMRVGFRSFLSAHQLSAESVNYSDFAVVRLFFEATRDAGFWNLHWSITNQPPNSDRIWKQWQSVKKPSVVTSTATAECDELSALYAFLVERAGVKGVGLFWPAANHTVAVWVVHPTTGPVIRVVVPTSQIFLGETDFFDTRKFDPWRQKTIYEYTRRDVPDTFELPKPLSDFFLEQVEKYGGATDVTLQQLRYLREGVLLGNWTPEDAARDALRKRRKIEATGPPEDLVALQNFAQDMLSGNVQ
jgi:hypothetical protein